MKSLLRMAVTISYLEDDYRSSDEIALSNFDFREHLLDAIKRRSKLGFNYIEHSLSTVDRFYLIYSDLGSKG